MAESQIVKLYQGKVWIKFYPGSHRYKAEGENDYLISVTATTGMKDKSGPLMWWAVGEMRDFLLARLDKGLKIRAEDVEEARKQHSIKKAKAATIGSRIHEWAEQWAKGENPEVPEEDDEETEKVRNGILAFLKWVDEHNVNIVEAETIVYSKKFNYVGKLDCIIKTKEGLCLGDYKTGKGIYTEFRYQTAAYQGAYAEEHGTRFRGRWLLSFGPETGEFRANFLPASDFKADYEAFLGLLTVKKREKALTDWSKEINS